MYLLIDDQRDLNAHAIARNSEAAFALLSLNCWEVIGFDHDLGENELSGYDILCKAIDYDWLVNVKEIQLVTSNPVGRQRMRQALENAGFFTANGLTFYRNK